MRLVHIILSPTHMAGTHQPRVHMWTGDLWREVVAAQIEQHKGYFVFNGKSDSVYMVASGWGCDDTRFLDGNGNKLTKEVALEMVAAPVSDAVEVRI